MNTFQPYIYFAIYIGCAIICLGEGYNAYLGINRHKKKRGKSHKKRHITYRRKLNFYAFWLIGSTCILVYIVCNAN